MSDPIKEQKDKNSNIVNKYFKKCNLCDLPFIVALTVIIPFIIITFIALQYNNIEMFKQISSVWGAWVGAVIGYFFGSRPVEMLTNKVERMLNEWEVSDTESEEEINDLLDDLDDLKDKYDKAVKDIQFIAIKYGENLDNDLLKRLKNDYEILT